MSNVDTTVAFTLRNDDGSSNTLWVAFEEYEGWAEALAEGIANSFADPQPTRARVTGAATYWVIDGAHSAGVEYGISFSKPDGIAHTIHTVDFNEERVVLTDYKTGDRKVGFTFKEFTERYGF